jgi:hypothetical protein
LHLNGPAVQVSPSSKLMLGWLNSTISKKPSIYFCHKPVFVYRAADDGDADLATTHRRAE